MKHFMILICLLAAILPLTRADEKDAPIRPAVTWSGPHSRITRLSYVRMVKQNDLLRTWYDHLGTQPKSGTHDPSVDPVVPEVDFERYMVLGIFCGEATNSDGVFIDSMQETDDELVVKFDELTYQTDSSPEEEDNDDIVTPFGIFVVPRSIKPVVFVENVQGLLGSPPIWKEQFRTGWVTK